MRKIIMVVLACLGAAVGAPAQENSAQEKNNSGWLLPAEKPAPRVSFVAAKHFFAADALSAPGSAPLTRAFFAAAEPAPLPRRSYGYNLVDETRWQLGFGFSDMVFNGPSPLKGNLMGVNSSLTYFINEWFAVEGVATSVYSSKMIYDREHIKVGVYGGGIRMVYREKRWQPWGHLAMGFAHEQPQTAWGGRNAFAYVFGGGEDYRFNQFLSFRIQVDLVGTAFFGAHQRHYQATTGVVLHF